MRKKIKGLIVICVLLCLFFTASSCSFFNKSNTDVEAQKEKEEIDPIKTITDKLKPNNVDSDAFYINLQADYYNDAYWGNLNYNISYEWSDINLDNVNYPDFADYGVGSKEEALAQIAKCESQGEDTIISQLYGFGFENIISNLYFCGVSEIYKDFEVIYNEGHDALIEDNQVIIPKWMYFYIYCTTLEEINCDIETMETVMSDDMCLQRDMFLGLDSEWSDKACFPTIYSLAIALGYYGVIDTAATKADMKISLPKKNYLVMEKDGEDIVTDFLDNPDTENCYELSVVGYYQTEIDKYFEEPLKKGDCDYNALANYLGNYFTIYFK